MKTGVWSEDEHDRFLQAIRQYPQGPWSIITECVGTRSIRQVQTHTQKYYEKILRRMRGLRKDRKTWARLEHRIDDDIMEFCKMMEASGKSPSRSALGPLGMPALTRPDRPLMMHMYNEDGTLAAMDPSSERSSEESDAGADDDDLPSLEESLDFFIAALGTLQP